MPLAAIAQATIAPNGPVAMPKVRGREKMPDPTIEPKLYQLYATLAALTFFALGSVLWGRCYAFGLAFLGAPESEATLLSLGYAFEQATKARRAPEYIHTLDGSGEKRIWTAPIRE